MNPNKTDGGRLITYENCESGTAIQEFILMQNQYEEITGRPIIRNYKDAKKQSSVLITMRQSFAPNEVDADTAHVIGCELAKRFFGNGAKYQYVVATHINAHCIHNHITWNVVSDNLTKFKEDLSAHQRMQSISDKLCEEYGLSIVVPNPNRDKRHRYTWINPKSYRTYIKNDIDRCIEKAKTYEEFLALMSEDYFCKTSGKYLAFRHRTNGQKRNIRVYTLGEAYRESAIRQRIASGIFIPVQETAQPQTYSQQLRDIQNMFHTKGVLRENKIKSYKDFASIISRIADQSLDLQTSMRALETRMDNLQEITDSFDVLEKNQPVMDELDAALLKDRYRLQHRDSIAAYQTAAAILQKHGINAKDDSSRKKYQALFQDASGKLETLWKQYDSLQAELQKISEAKRTIEKVYTEEKTQGGILNER